MSTIKYEYSYKVYDDCPEATKYSKNIGSSHAFDIAFWFFGTIIYIIVVFVTVNDFCKGKSLLAFIGTILFGVCMVLLLVKSFGKASIINAKCDAFYLKKKRKISEETAKKMVKDAKRDAWRSAAPALPYVYAVLLALYAIAFSIYWSYFVLISIGVIAILLYLYYRARERHNKALAYEMLGWSEEEDDDDEDSSSLSEIDKLREYKSLLDEGIITQEEFDKKKKQILGI